MGRAIETDDLTVYPIKRFILVKNSGLYSTSLKFWDIMIGFLIFCCQLLLEFYLCFKTLQRQGLFWRYESKRDF